MSQDAHEPDGPKKLTKVLVLVNIQKALVLLCSVRGRNCVSGWRAVSRLCHAGALQGPYELSWSFPQTRYTYYDGMRLLLCCIAVWLPRLPAC